jgi:quinol monooxygenase YgiN
MTKTLSRFLIAAVVLTAVCLPCFAQQKNLRTVLFVKLKLDQQDNWKAAVKDLKALHQKAGSEESFTIWESETGPAEFAVVWYSEKWKEMGEQDPKLKSSAAELASIFSRLNGQGESLSIWIDEMQPDLTVRSQEIPAMVRTGRTRVMPGKMDDMKALFREQIVPALKKSGATSYGVAVARYGTPNNEIHTYLGLSGWADLDSPFGVEKGMSPSDYKQFMAKVQTLVENTEWIIWKYQPDLSYVPASAK